MTTRIETDSLGPIEVPSDAYWGAQTQRSLELFAIGSERMPLPLLRAYAHVKLAAAHANVQLGELDSNRGRLIAAAAREVIDGTLDAHFPLRVWQTGSGTQTHMNLNEVIAHRANELAGGARGDKHPVHPNDHVNRGQSTNDTFPTAMHVATCLELRGRLLPALDRARQTLESKARDYADLVKIGRTHLQDATPLTLGQEIGGWSAQLAAAGAAVRALEPTLHPLAVGGTAVGTGLNAHPELGAEVARGLAEATGIPFTSAENRFAALAGHEALASISGALATLAGSLLKVANDVRWLASGPRCGLGELRIPENEPGSSIMPGKINPTQAEALIMVSLEVLGAHTTVSVAAGQGSFELNVCKPVIAYNVLRSIDLLSDAIRSFDVHCLRGLEPVPEVLERNVSRSLMLVTALTPHIGYEKAAQVAKKAHAEGLSLREAALALGVAEPGQLDDWLRPEHMLTPRASSPSPPHRP